jgi:hypothetical protein
LSFFPDLMSSSSICQNILFGKHLDLSTTFTIILFFDKIRWPMIALPEIINSLLEFNVSIKRI